MRPRIARRRGTITYSVSHWLIMKSVYPAIAPSTASVPRRWLRRMSELVGAIARIKCLGSFGSPRPVPFAPRIPFALIRSALTGADSVFSHECLKIRPSDIHIIMLPGVHKRGPVSIDPAF